MDDKGRFYVFNLEHHVCDWGYWQLSGIPCIHAVPYILHSKKDNSQFLHGWLKQESYLATYSGLIHPILDKASWLRADGDGILPPVVRRPLWSLKKNRRREIDEVPAEKRRYRIQCKHYKEFGHNKRGCLVNPQNENKRTRHYKVKITASKRSFTALTLYENYHMCSIL